MNCQGCGYRLWNLSSRMCPECGRGFRPSDFEFRPNAVEYCCPECEQTYFGTSEIGHLVPQAFDCVTCGKALHMDDMLLRPADGTDEEQTAAGRNPWLDRAKRGRIGAWFATIGMGMGKPGELMRCTPPQSEAGQAWWYMIASSYIYFFLGIGLPFGLFMLWMMAAFNSFAGNSGGAALSMGMFFVGFFAIAIVLGPLFMAVGVLIWGASAHVVLLGGKPSHGIARTYQAMCYSSGPMTLMGIPCLGLYISSVGQIWWVISAIIALRDGQNVHGGRATLAVLWLPILLTIASVGLSTYVQSQPTVWVGGPQSTSVSGAYNEAHDLYYALTSSAFGSQGPDHALVLVNHGNVIPSDFIGGSTQTYLSSVPLTPTQTLEDFNNANPAQQQAITQTVLAAQPASLVAHRVGDFVFTYHGIDLQHGDPGLWVLLFCPDPANNPMPTPNDTVTVVQRDGSISQYSFSLFTQELNQQNTLRTKYNLPPLPDPFTITHQSPAIAP